MEPRGSPDLETLIAQAASLRRLAVRLVGEGEADDVVQDAVAAGIGRAPADASALRPWLVHVVRNFAAGRRRGDARRRAREIDAARREELPPAGDMVERMEVQRVVAEEVLRLDEPYRATVLALHFEGLRAADYARDRGVPGATVRSWSKRGLDQLRARLDRRFGGDRAAWSACLLPLARAETAAVPLAIAGGLLMKKFAVAAAVVLLASLAWWTVADERAGVTLGVSPATAAVELADLAPPPPVDALEAAAPVESAERRVEVAAASRTPAATPTRVSGRVTWSPDGAPAFDVGVRLEYVLSLGDDGAPPQVFTDRDGRFAFDGVAPGMHRVRLDRANASRNVVVEAGGDHDASLALPRADEVVGRVLDPDGVPVPGAEVCIRESNNSWTRTVATSGADGGFRFEGADEWVAFFARAPGRAPSGMRQATRRTPRTLDLYLGSLPGRNAGVVLDPWGKPFEGALVDVLPTGATGVDPAGQRVMRSASRAVRTDAAGRFELRDSEPGPSRLSVRAPGFPRIVVQLMTRPGLATETVVRFPKLARVRGRVAGVDGRPLEAAQVAASSTGLVNAWTLVSCGPDGRFDTGAVPAGRVRLVATHASGSAATLDTELAPGADLEWSPVIGALESIRGRLVDLDGAPLGARTISLSANKRTATTDGDGRFAFDALKPQEYTVWFAQGTLSSQRALAVPGGADVVLVAEETAARVIGRVVDAQGRPRAGVQVESDRARFLTGGDGAFELSALRSGKREITARLTRLVLFPLATVDVRPGALHDVGSVVIPDDGSLRVRVRSDEGVPIAWVAPTLRRVGPGLQWVHDRGWGSTAEWTIDALTAGEYELGVRDGGAAAQLKRITIRAGQRTEAELDLRFGASVEVEASVAAGAARWFEIEFEFTELGGAPVARRSIRSGFGATTASEQVVLAPGAYECTARTADGRTGRTRIAVGADGAPRARIELR